MHGCVALPSSPLQGGPHSRKHPIQWLDQAMLAVDSGAANDLASQVKRLTEDADTFQKSQQDTQELVSASVSWSLGGHMVVTW